MMNRSSTVAWLWAMLSLLFLCSCQGRPPESVRADRDAWTFYRGVFDRGIITPAEKDLSDTALIDWDARLRLEEGRASDPKQEALQIAAAVGDALIRTDVTAFMQKHYPDVFPILDTTEDGVLTLAELQAIDPHDPKVWVAILFALRRK